MNCFPDGTSIDSWFNENPQIELSNLGKQFFVTDYQILDDGKEHTKEFQNLIDNLHSLGGGVIVVPKGTYITGALFFKQGVNLFLEEGATILGSEDLSLYPNRKTRIEGQTRIYTPALINADNVDGFVIAGKGVIDGNGYHWWKEFWDAYKEDNNCSNLLNGRPRLIYISNSKNCVIHGLKLQNSAFWTSHIYKSHHIKLIDCSFCSPIEPLPAPSTDAIDIDACHDVLIKNCYMEVNDDAIALKGGKGVYADMDDDNGPNERVIIEGCKYGFCHSALTCGSESIHNKNIILRNAKLNGTWQLTHFKLRPDTPSHYEYISIENIVGTITGSFINLNPWAQYSVPVDRKDMPISKVEHISYKNCHLEAGIFFNVLKSDKYILDDFSFSNIKVITKDKGTNLDKVVEFYKLDEVDIISKETAKIKSKK